jgi:Phosphodiester glycosidase
MGVALNDPGFWSKTAGSYGLLQQDGSLQYILLDRKFKMQPLIRNTKTTFTQFLATDPRAKTCKVIVNGNLYGLTLGGRAAAVMGNPDDPSQTEIQGQVIESGMITGGDSRPDSFWFGQLLKPLGDAWPWIYSAGKGDPPALPATIAAIGGVGPLIVGTLPYGVGNKYKPGAPPGISEPATGEPPPEARPYMIQRNNATFVDANSKPPETGKTILAYSSAKRTILVIVQEHGSRPGTTHEAVANTLAQQGFDAAIFMDGSDSATLVVDGTVRVTPGQRKNDTIDVGVGFRL